ncbi:GLPGLI family protein [Elizabethkingia ursingii]|uniref:GLPGLI family protein n=1 Tax=Elizabethkingia ursingii TaxID=1756150 RepID=A0AAJ3TP79_9FLAO|nr:GLPGLI family protein [Elizabethkingia ursingii]AQX09162.1 GLPGLI family protein [Elizabethkingia ursingii]OPB74470.1 GLPGLI family protein [Elizabethkingia ursingii]
MNRKITFFIFLLIINQYFTQGIKEENVNRFAYELTYKIDSTDLGEVRKELFFLDILGKESRFASQNKLMKDSVIYSVGVTNDATSALSMMGRMKTKFNYNIYTNAEKQEQMIVETIGMKNYKYQLPLSKMNWKIGDEVKKIGVYNCQKATLEIGGRNWTAWFTPDIPLNFGPYKFQGLPGLIVSVSDEKSHYSFMLQGNKKEKVLFSPLTIQRVTEIKPKDLAKLRENANGVGVFNMSGFQLSPEMQREAEKRLKERKKKENNLLELKPFEVF